MMSLYKQFRALPFKIHSTNPLRRITRKNAVADEIIFFPPEGHVCLRINSYNYLYFGSARRGQESTWSMWNKLCRVSYVVDGNDASIENLLGGQFPHLQSSAGFYFFPKNCLFVWDGLNLSSFTMSNKLYVVKLNDTKVVVEIIQPPDGISLRKFEGNIPSGRCGHSFTYIFILVQFYMVEFVFHIKIHVLVHLVLQMLQTIAVFMCLIKKAFFGQNFLSQDLIHEHITPLHRWTSEV